MRRLSKLSLHLALGLTSGLLMAAPVMAQDLGTYRPGTAYQSVSSPAADVCNSHCAGDAQCSAWNYVKVNPRAPGVCEFLASASSPVPSAISISGENTSHKSFARPVSQGGTNTVRVGTSAAPAPSRAAVTRPSSNRRVVREAVPQRISPQATVNRRAPQHGQTAVGASLTTQQNQYRRQTGDFRQDPRIQQGLQQQRLQQQRQAALQQQNLQQSRGLNGQQPQFQPFLDNGVTNRAPRGTSPQNVREQLRQNQARQGQLNQGQLNQGHFIQKQGNPAQAQQQATQRGESRLQGSQPRSQRRRQAGGRPPIGQPIGPVSASIAEQNARLQPNRQAPIQASIQASAPQRPASVNLPRASANAPVTHQNARAAFARRQADLAAIASGNSVDPIQQSLYGSLNDDVKVRAQLKTLPSDPDAPIATAASRPVTAVQTQPLGKLAGAAGEQLAGGPR